MTAIRLKSGMVDLIGEPGGSVLVDACVPESVGYRMLHRISRCGRSKLRFAHCVGGNIGIEASVSPATGAAIRRMLPATTG
jgi:hypothetical protein